LQQTDEYLNLLKQQQSVPGDFSTNIKKELSLLEIEGAVFDEKQLVELRKMLDAAFVLFKWFDADRRVACSGLHQLLGEWKYQDEIRQLITEVVDDFGNVRDNSSDALRKTSKN
jgi:DNA mismatch repair protein MutS2